LKYNNVERRDIMENLKEKTILQLLDLRYDEKLLPEERREVIKELRNRDQFLGDMASQPFRKAQ
jgi:predicted Fe-S protein YdhL (DUF1289 family)